MASIIRLKQCIIQKGLTELEMEISTSKPYLLFGENSFSLKKHVSMLKNALNQGDLADSNTSILDGQRISFDELNAKCATVPFLASYRLVIVENLFSSFEQTKGRAKASKSKPAKFSESLSVWKNIAGNNHILPDSTVLIFTDGQLSTSNALLSSTRSRLQVKEFKLPQGEQLLNWIRNAATEKGATIPLSSTKLLSNLVGPNL